ncbi:hypothetical protein LY78DRAFT_298314 [Colletotrichum sublineola]|nr:hypothetical protein LY78DRAFT_298314 [Colletotrichum sublineola]
MDDTTIALSMLLLFFFSLSITYFFFSLSLLFPWVFFFFHQNLSCFLGCCLFCRIQKVSYIPVITNEQKKCHRFEA